MENVPWQKYSGWLVVLAGLVRAIWWLVSKASDVDFLATRWEAIMGIIGASWFSLVVVAIGLGLIFWNSKRKAILTPSTSSPIESVDHIRDLLRMEINIVHFRHLWNDAGTQANAEPYLWFDVVVRNNTNWNFAIKKCEGRATIDGDICTLFAELQTHPVRVGPWNQTIPIIRQPLLKDKGVELINKIDAGKIIQVSLSTISLLMENDEGATPLPPMQIRVSFDIDPIGITLERSDVTKRPMVLKGS